MGPGISKCRPERSQAHQNVTQWFQRWCAANGVSRRELAAVLGVTVAVAANCAALAATTFLLMGDRMRMARRRIDAGAAVQRSVQRSAQRSVQRTHEIGARGWTMVCDDGVHQDRPIGRCPIGLGYEVRT